MSDAQGPRRARLDFDGSALFSAGYAPPKNYAGNPFPFRASSHFLYFVGRPIEGAHCVVRDGEWTVFVDPPDDDDALWHGPAPSLAELAKQLGCAVRPKSELSAAARGAATLAAPDLRTRAEQSSLLDRDVSNASDADGRLADAVIALRSVHDEAAIAELRTAAEATHAAHVAGMAATHVGAFEYEVSAAMEYALAKRGMSTAYSSIVTVHGEVLHNHHHDGQCVAGDLLLADVGAETAGGFAGDVTRTWPVNGKYSATQREIYQVVLASQERSIAAVKPGARYRDVHLEACLALTEGLVELGILRGEPSALVEQGAHALFFPHGVGHLLGLDVHDMEDLGDRAGYAPGRKRSEQFGLGYLRLDRDLEAGMAVTIEPGFYQVPAILEGARFATLRERMNADVLAKFADVRGIRIEDDVLVTASGREVLTAGVPKSIGDVEAAVG